MFLFYSCKHNALCFILYFWQIGLGPIHVLRVKWNLQFSSPLCKMFALQCRLQYRFKALFALDNQLFCNNGCIVCSNKPGFGIFFVVFCFCSRRWSRIRAQCVQEREERRCSLLRAEGAARQTGSKARSGATQDCPAFYVVQGHSPFFDTSVFWLSLFGVRCHPKTVSQETKQEQNLVMFSLRPRSRSQ